MIPAGKVMNIESVAVHQSKSHCVMNASTVGKAAAEVDTQQFVTWVFHSPLPSALAFHSSSIFSSVFFLKWPALSSLSSLNKWYKMTVF